MRPPAGRPMVHPFSTKVIRALLTGWNPPTRKSADAPHAWKGRSGGNSRLLPVAQGQFVEPNRRGRWVPPNGLRRIFLPHANSSPRQHSGTPSGASVAIVGWKPTRPGAQEKPFLYRRLTPPSRGAGHIARVVGTRSARGRSQTQSHSPVITSFALNFTRRQLPFLEMRIN